jgi:prepilin signal peptidase PulO-like enzyme (type II secretory pathway)
MSLVFDNIFNPHNWAMVPFPFWSLVFFVFGCIVGSFLNVCIYRMPLDLSVVSPPSHCPHCKYSIPFYLNVPLVTWLMLKGRCKNCGAPISPRYFIVELLTGLMFLSCWLAFGHSSPALALVYSMFLAGLIVATFTDVEHLIIPDEITLGGATAGLLISICLPSLHHTASHLYGMGYSALGIVAGAGIIYGLVRGGKWAFGKYTLDLDPESRVVFTESAIVLPPKRVTLERLYRRSGWFAFQASRIELADRCYTNVETAVSAARIVLKLPGGLESFDRSTAVHVEAIFDRPLSSRETAKITGSRWNPVHPVVDWLTSMGESLLRLKKTKIHSGDWLVFGSTAAWLCRPEMLFGDGEIFYRETDAINFQAREIRLPSGSWHDVPVCLKPLELRIGDATFEPEAVPCMEAVTDKMIMPREAMGLGDVKFMAAIGAFLGWEAIIFTLVLASMIGAVYGGVMVALRKKDWSGRIYFGPFLALAATIWIFAGPALAGWYFAFSTHLLSRLLPH